MISVLQGQREGVLGVLRLYQAAMCNSDVSLPCTGGSEPSASDAAGEEVGSTLEDRKGGYRLRRRNGRMIRARKTVEEKRVCGKGQKRKVTWYHRLLGYRLVTV